MRQATNCFLINSDGQILLSMKKRGFGVGKWNGAGGKLGPDETAEQAAIREVKEEIGVDVDPKDLEKAGEVLYHNPDPNWGMYVHIYIVRKWKGEPAESEEMKPQWYEASEVPALNAWADFKYTFPQTISGKKFKADFAYKADGETIENFDITEVENFS